MNWWSSVASAKASMRSWVTSSHSPVTGGWPIAAVNREWAVSPLLGMRAIMTDAHDRDPLGPRNQRSQVAPTSDTGRGGEARASLAL
jgi:hypothetical protein